MRLFILLALLVSSIQAHAEDQYRIDSTRYLNAGALPHNASFENVITIFNTRNAPIWQESQSNAVSLGFSSDSYWFYWPITVNTDERSIFRINNPALDEVTLWFLNSQHRVLNRYSGGFRKPFKQRQVEDVGFSFEVDRRVHYVVAKIKTNNAFYVDATLQSSSHFLNFRFLDGWVFGTFSGLILIMLLYNIYLSLQSELRFMRIYCVWIVSLYLNQTTVTGFTYQYFWPNLPSLSHYVGSISGFMLSVCGLWFMYELLNLKRHFPSWLRNGFLVYLAVGIVLALAVLMNLMKHPLNASSNYILTTIVWALSVSIWRSLTGDKRAMWLLLAWMTLIVPGFLRIIMITGQIEGSYALDVAVFAGTSSETMLIALLLASIIHQAQKETLRLDAELAHSKAAANTRLRHDIAAKTKRLHRVNRRLSLSQWKDTRSGFANKAYLYNRIQRLVEQQRGSFDAYSLLLINIDNMRQVERDNDEASYERCIKPFAHLLKSNFSPFSPLIAHHSGECFVLLYKDQEMASTVQHCHAFIQALDSLAIEHNTRHIRLTCSTTGLLFSMHRSLQAEAIIQRSEALISDFYESGPNQLQVEVLEHNTVIQRA